MEKCDLTLFVFVNNVYKVVLAGVSKAGSTDKSTDCRRGQQLAYVDCLCGLSACCSAPSVLSVSESLGICGINN